MWFDWKVFVPLSFWRGCLWFWWCFQSIQCHCIVFRAVVMLFCTTIVNQMGHAFGLFLRGRCRALLMLRQIQGEPETSDWPVCRHCLRQQHSSWQATGRQLQPRQSGASSRTSSSMTASRGRVHPPSMKPGNETSEKDPAGLNCEAKGYCKAITCCHRVTVCMCAGRVHTEVPGLIEGTSASADTGGAEGPGDG